MIAYDQVFQELTPICDFALAASRSTDKTAGIHIPFVQSLFL